MIAADFIAEADTDLVGLWQLCARVEAEGLTASDRRQAVLAISAALVAEATIRCCMYDPAAEAFRVWPPDEAAAMQRIATGFDEVGGRPMPGDVVWFGTERFLRDLIQPRAIWPASAGAS